MSYRVCVSPSNQDDNPYAWGNTTEAVQCGRIAGAVCKALARCDIETICPHMDGMAQKCIKSDAFDADLHLPIHSNASVAHNAVGTRVYCSAFGGAGHEACKAIFKHLAPLTPSGGDGIKEAPTWYEVRVPSAPTAYIEVDFHDVPEVAKWIIEHTDEIGEAIAHGVCDYFGADYVPPAEEDGPGCTELEAKVAELEERVAKLEPRYHTLFECPGWAQASIKALIEAGLLFGDKAGDLNLTDDLLRTLVVLARILEVKSA